MCGLDVFKPHEISGMSYNCSRDSPEVINNAISGREEFKLDTHISKRLEVKMNISEAKQKSFEE